MRFPVGDEPGAKTPRLVEIRVRRDELEVDPLPDRGQQVGSAEPGVGPADGEFHACLGFEMALERFEIGDEENDVVEHVCDSLIL